MTKADFDVMDLDGLRQYVLAHREVVNAFRVYVDRSKASGRTIQAIQVGRMLWNKRFSKQPLVKQNQISHAGKS
jgi:hypothetical protein